jgi:hypothetical protein
MEILLKKVIDLLIKKTKYWNSKQIRTTAISALVNFIIENDGEINRAIFNTVLNSLEDKWPEARKAALGVLQTTFSPDDKNLDSDYTNKALTKVENISRTDSMHDVRRKAELCLMAIREKKVAKLRKTIKTKQSIKKHSSELVNNATKAIIGPSSNFTNPLH